MGVGAARGGGCGAPRPEAGYTQGAHNDQIARSDEIARNDQIARKLAPERELISEAVAIAAILRVGGDRDVSS